MKLFVTRKITRGLSRIKLGIQKKLILGNLSSLRDWGHAKDYVKMQWMMLQQKTPDDYVIATGVFHTVRDFVNKVAECLDMKIEWTGTGLNEKGIDENGNVIVEVNKRYFRNTEVDTLLGDANKAKKKIGLGV